MAKYPGTDVLDLLGTLLNEYDDPGNRPDGFGNGVTNFDGGTYAVSMVWFDGDLHCAFVEPEFKGNVGYSGNPMWKGRGPICKRWDGSAWVLVGTDMEPGLADVNMSLGGKMDYYGEEAEQVALPSFGVTSTTGDRAIPSRPQLCHDGTTLYCAYVLRVTQPTPDGEGDWDARNVVIKYFDGSDWVLITEIAAETYNTWQPHGLDTGLGPASFGSVLSVGASPDDAGNVYVSWYEDGPQSGQFGQNAHNYRQRWHVRGFSTAGSQIYDHDLIANDFPGGYHDWIDHGSNAPRDYSHRFTHDGGGGTLYLMFPGTGANETSMLDVLTDTLTVVPFSAFFGGIWGSSVTAISSPFTRTGEAEKFYYGGGYSSFNVFYPMEVATDASGEAGPLHGPDSALSGGILDGIHAVDDKNVILVTYNPPLFTDPSFPNGAIFHDNCGPAIEPGDQTWTGVMRLSSQYDDANKLLYIATMQQSDGEVIVLWADYIPDLFSCGGPPVMDGVVFRAFEQGALNPNPAGDVGGSAMDNVIFRASELAAYGVGRTDNDSGQLTTMDMVVFRAFDGTSPYAAPDP